MRKNNLERKGQNIYFKRWENTTFLVLLLKHEFVNRHCYVWDECKNAKCRTPLYFHPLPLQPNSNICLTLQKKCFAEGCLSPLGTDVEQTYYFCPEKIAVLLVAIMLCRLCKVYCTCW